MTRTLRLVGLGVRSGAGVSAAAKGGQPTPVTDWLDPGKIRLDPELEQQRRQFYGSSERLDEDVKQLVPYLQFCLPSVFALRRPIERFPAV